MARSVVVHGHYYQPPREDPWLEEIERQPTAAPFHDWNARIAHECYRAVVAARVLDAEGRIARVVNTLAYTSFDAGPTLLAWLEAEAPATYAAVLDADRASAARLGGHGNAIAQAYHHTILPLASRRDKMTEVRWGVADFRRRFGRDPEGLWLPETAVDDETLDVLAAEGIRFTVLAPHQVEGAPPPRGMPGLYRTASGREIALFVYDGPLSHGVAFGSLLREARVWAARLTAGLGDDPDGPDELLALASDGETYGHHHRFGDMALAAVIDTLERRPGVRLENFASVLAAHPATTPVTLVAPSAWSCSHGVERWRADCGCGASSIAPAQSWRAPLREGLEALAEGLHAIFEREGSEYFEDPWAARDEYEERLPAPGSRRSATASAERREPGAESESPLPLRALELLELERNALRLFTSCAWFFDDVDRLEPLQVLRYAARAIELAGGAEGEALEARLLEALARAPSNDAASGTARDVYLGKAKPRRSPFVRAVAAQALGRVLGADDAGVPRARGVIVEQQGLRVVVGERRTGRVHEFDTTAVPGGAAGDGALRRARAAAVDVRPAGGTAADTTRLALGDLLDADREAIERALRRRIVVKALGDDARARLAAGTPLAEVVPGALLDAVAALARDRSAPAVARVLDLADLAEAEGVDVTFDAQTAFARVRDEMAGGSMLLAPVAERLGFKSPSALGARPSARAGAESREHPPASGGQPAESGPLAKR